MSVVIQTARVSYTGPDRLDITAKSASDDGKPFAPTWTLVKWGLSMREQYKKKLAENDPNAENFWTWTWKVYSWRYLEKMRQSYVVQRWAWDKVLERQRVVFVCYCTDADSCHRKLLAEAFVKLGATYEGEIDE